MPVLVHGGACFGTLRACTGTRAPVLLHGVAILLHWVPVLVHGVPVVLQGVPVVVHGVFGGGTVGSCGSTLVAPRGTQGASGLTEKKINWAKFDTWIKSK